MTKWNPTAVPYGLCRALEKDRWSGQQYCDCSLGTLSALSQSSDEVNTLLCKLSLEQLS